MDTLNLHIHLSSNDNSSFFYFNPPTRHESISGAWRVEIKKDELSLDERSKAQIQHVHMYNNMPCAPDMFLSLKKEK
jgi:hypothetical protein